MIFFIKNFFPIFCLTLLNFSVFAQHEHHTASASSFIPTTKKSKQTVRKPSRHFIQKQAIGTERIVNLIVSYKKVNFAGKDRFAIAVNNQIPAPTLHFREGDQVSIRVFNRLDKPTSIHWHGVLVPWQMDGVARVSQKPIPPGGVFDYRFQLMQSGTYWYHAHFDTQEQEGLYGAFIIDSPIKPRYNYSKDFVVVLSDWSNIQADKIFANLKKDGDYFSPRFPLQPSLMKFIHDYSKASSEERKNLINDYSMMQQMRMSIYDISDVAYDAFLLNGRPIACPWNAHVKVGDRVRLRFIGAAGSTIYRVKIPSTQMEIVHVQGNDVKPYWVDDFSIAPGETYDVLVTIKKDEPYVIYAESLDTLGAAIGVLTTELNQRVALTNIPPFPEPLPVTREMMHNMMNMNMVRHSSSAHSPKKIQNTHDMSEMQHQSMRNTTKKSHHPATMADHMDMPTEPTIIGDMKASPNSFQSTTSGTKYQYLTAAVETNNPHKPIDSIIRMELFGYMDRFIWFINGLPEYKAKPILIEPGKRYRIIFTNNSMMRHPMHIHGHWFILRNGHGAYDPLLHTIEVSPGATAVADLDTDASGQWFFHCHHLYHMVAGMARVFQYNTIIEVAKGEVKPENTVLLQNYTNRPIVRVDEQVPIDSTLINHPVGHHSGLYLANIFDIGEDPFHNVQELTFKGLYGSDYNKLELLTEDAEINKGKVENADIDIFYWHLISQFWAVKGGINYFYQPAKKPYWQPGIGIEGLMPYFIDTNARAYFHAGSTKFDIELSRDTQITNNFFIRLGIRSILATKAVANAEIGSGLNQMRYILRPYYRLMSGLNIFTEFEHDQDYGLFRNFQKKAGELSSENTLTFGISWLF